jgi:hypothetical protein
LPDPLLLHGEPDLLSRLGLAVAEALLAVPAGVLDTVGDAGAVLLLVLGVPAAGASLTVGAGTAVCSWKAPFEAAVPFSGGVGPGHGRTSLRCVLVLVLVPACGRCRRHVGLDVGVGLPGWVESVGVTVGVTVGVAEAGPVLGVLAGVAVAEPDLVPEGLADGTVLAAGLQVEVGLGLAVVLVAPPWPGELPLPCRTPVPAPEPPPLPPWPLTDVVLPLPDEPMVVIACRTPGTAAAVPAKMHTAARATTGRSQTMPRWAPSRASPPRSLGRPATNRADRSSASAASASRCRVCRP